MRGISVSSGMDKGEPRARSITRPMMQPVSGRSISCCACRCRGRASRTIRATGRRQLDIDGSKIPYFDQAAWAGIATLNGLPATTMPIGHTDIGLLLGVQIIGGYLQTARRSRLPSGSNVNLAASPLRRCCSVATTVPHNRSEARFRRRAERTLFMASLIQVDAEI